jgi:bacterioferritin-associated ferredoxin
MPVDRCVCFNVTLAQLKQYAQEHQCGFDELQRVFGCGRGCSLCVPYVKAMLATGRTSFPADQPAPTESPPPGTGHL